MLQLAHSKVTIKKTVYIFFISINYNYFVSFNMQQRYDKKYPEKLSIFLFIHRNFPILFRNKKSILTATCCKGCFNYIVICFIIYDRMPNRLYLNVLQIKHVYQLLFLQNEQIHELTRGTYRKL